MNYMNDSTEFQDIESICSGIFPTVPDSRQSFQVLDLCWVATKPCDLIHGICLGHRETFFGNPRSMFFSSQTPYQGILDSTTRSATGGNHVQKSAGGLVAKGEEQIGSTIPMAKFCKKTINHEFFLSSRSTTEFYG